ncbi:MAG: hypothetical protein AB7I50_04190 [Vicinamibacterales bacterium]
MSATEIVRPSSGRLETGLIAGVVVLAMLGAGIAASVRRPDEGPKRLFDWQVSAFYDLNETDQAVFNALSGQTEILWWRHGDLLNFGTPEQRKDPWPSVKELQEELLMEPFVEDVAWEKQGRIQWQRVASFSFAGSTVYFGSQGQVPGQSAYLLMLSHVHKGASYVNGATVWVHENASATTPKTVTRDSLILNGWKEVVPYSGAAEVDRLRGVQR